MPCRLCFVINYPSSDVNYMTYTNTSCNIRRSIITRHARFQQHVMHKFCFLAAAAAAAAIRGYNDVEYVTSPASDVRHKMASSNMLNDVDGGGRPAHSVAIEASTANGGDGTPEGPPSSRRRPLEALFPVTFKASAAYLVTKLRLYTTFSIRFMVGNIIEQSVKWVGHIIEHSVKCLGNMIKQSIKLVGHIIEQSVKW